MEETAEEAGLGPHRRWSKASLDIVNTLRQKFLNSLPTKLTPQINFNLHSFSRHLFSLEIFQSAGLHFLSELMGRRNVPFLFAGVSLCFYRFQDHEFLKVLIRGPSIPF